MRFLLDTNIVSVWARQTSPILTNKLLATSPADLCISVLVEHELRFGFALTPGTRAENMTLRLLEALPECDFLISITAEFFDLFRWQVEHCWPLKRADHVTLISDPLPLTTWAQDNGKAGWIGSEGSSSATPATPPPETAW